MEKRQSFFSTEFETRETGSEKILEGYFIRFNAETELWPGVYETIDPNAIGDISNKDIRALFNHDSNIALGRTQNGTLTLSQDSMGLRGAITINEDDPQAMGAYARVKRGDVAGCSFGFYPVREDILDREDGTTLFVVRELELFEVSPCTFPAYPQTEIHARQKNYDNLKKRQLDIKKKQLKERFTNG